MKYNKITKKGYNWLFIIGLFLFSFLFFNCDRTSKLDAKSSITGLKKGFLNPPDSVKPGVYWYFMEGWKSKEGLTKDLESMKNAGIGRVIFLEVNVGVPEGRVKFLSDEWFDLFKYAERECRRLGIHMTLGVGPGWAGSGGPWIDFENSMKHLVSSSTKVSGAGEKEINLPLPEPREPYFGEKSLTTKLKEKWQKDYKDIAVLAYPAPENKTGIKNIDEKALYYRDPYSSKPDVNPFLPSSANYQDLSKDELISKKEIIDLTDKVDSNGVLKWSVPEGDWIIKRFVTRNNGMITRPAPIQGMGFESDKFDSASTSYQLKSYVGRILDSIGGFNKNSSGGLKTLHLDSWEMGAQNWSDNFRDEFFERRGFDPLPFLPVYSGDVVESKEVSERFLWDLRQTSNELILENYMQAIKDYAHENNMSFSNEPYDMDPAADLDLGFSADLPMGEFWSNGFGFNTSYSVIEATSIAHIKGVPIVQSESFTADNNEAWKQYPGSMKNQGDWAFAAGVNEMYYHTFAHKPLADSLAPGITMGPYGVHWDRKQTWWPMVDDYHQYISRSQYLLQQGSPVAEFLYLTPEGAPMVFTPPKSAMKGDSIMPDYRGYAFDGVSPKQLYKTRVQEGKIIFPSGASYYLLVLPKQKTMTPELLNKIKSLVKNGATVLGNPPVKSPSLADLPKGDRKVNSGSKELWGENSASSKTDGHQFGKGKIIRTEDNEKKHDSLYPVYSEVAEILDNMGVFRDFVAKKDSLRYTHRKLDSTDIYFVSNRTDMDFETKATFRSTKGSPELWNPIMGQTRMLPEFSKTKKTTTIPLSFAPYQSYFIVFTENNEDSLPKESQRNFPETVGVDTIRGSWKVSFNPEWGGPKEIVFDSLQDWRFSEKEGIKFYSGIAKYKKEFHFEYQPEFEGNGSRIYLDLGKVKDIGKIYINGEDLGTLWTAPMTIDVTKFIKEGKNSLEIQVANRWPNRLIGDQQFKNDGVREGKFPQWFLEGKKRPSARFAFTTFNPYKENDALLPSGLLGPVTIKIKKF